MYLMGTLLPWDVVSVCQMPGHFTALKGDFVSVFTVPYVSFDK